MPTVQEEPEREKRIMLEIIVDAYGPEEQAMGWYYYLQDVISFPYTAICIAERKISPIRMGDELEIVDMALEEECEHEMFVETSWGGRTLAIPLAQVRPVDATDEKTKEAVADWHYWVARGYEL
jgi:hypothetical protein